MSTSRVARTVLAAAALRVALVLAGFGSYLMWRVEVSTPANGALKLREGLALIQLSISPYSGSSCHAAPLVLKILAPLLQHDILFALPNIICDLLTAGLLYWLEARLCSSASAASKAMYNKHTASARQAASPWQHPSLHLAPLFLFNPFAVAACISGSVSSMENLCTVAAICAGVLGSAPLATFALAVGTYVGLHPVLLLAPVILLIVSGPEQVFLNELLAWHPAAAITAPDPCAAAGTAGVGTDDRTDAVAMTPLTAAAPSKAPLAMAAAAAATPVAADCQLSSHIGIAAKPTLYVPPAVPHLADDDGPGTSTDVPFINPEPHQTVPQQQPPAACVSSAQNGRADVRGYSASAGTCLLWYLLWVAALIVLSDLAIRQFPQDQCLPTLARLLRPPLVPMQAATSSLKGLHRTCPASGASPGEAFENFGSAGCGGGGCHGGEAGGVISILPGSSQGCWLTHVYGLYVSAEDLQPNLGQFWYFFTEMFDAYVAFFLFVFHSHAVLLTVPLALRFPHRPLAVAACQLIITAMFRPYPSVADVASYLAVLPLLRPQLQHMQLGLFTVNSGLLLAVLAPAMWHQWINVESANSNFFWSITLLLGAWHTSLLLQLLLLTVRVERLEAGKPEAEGIPASLA